MSDESPSDFPPSRRREPSSNTDANAETNPSTDTNVNEEPDAPENADGTDDEDAAGASGTHQTDSTLPFEEAWQEAEPDEFDPTDLGPDPPSVSVPDPTDADVPPGIARVFWGLVVTINVAVFAVSIGAMLVGFRGQWRVGGGLLVLGVLLFVRAGWRYRQYTIDQK